MKKNLKAIVIIVMMIVFMKPVYAVWYVDSLEEAQLQYYTGLVSYNDETYYFIDGEIQTGLNYIAEESNYYYFDSDGRMVTGFVEIDGEDYFFNEAMQHGLFEVYDDYDGRWYHYYANETNGVIQKNQLVTVDEYRTYYLGEYGRAESGFKEINGNMYYFVDQYCEYYDCNQYGYDSMLKGMINVYIPSQDAYYAFDNDGRMLTGIHDDYYFDDDGRRQTGLISVDGKDYYFNDIRQYGFISLYDDYGDMYHYYADLNTGELQKNQLICVYDGNCYLGVYYFGASGKSEHHFQTINGNTYYFGDESDAYSAYVGRQWISENNSYYFFDNNGVMQTGIQYDNGAAYYFGVDGKEQTGLITIGGKSYYFDDFMQFGLIGYIDGYFSYYYYADETTGEIQKNKLVRLYDDLYYFGAAGKSEHGFKTIDGNTYYFGENFEYNTDHHYQE